VRSVLLVSDDDPIPMPLWGVSALERMYAVYEGPRCLRWLTRFAWGRRRLKRFYTLRHMATMQNALNLAFSDLVDKL
jgi:hypothetical protein